MIAEKPSDSWRIPEHLKAPAAGIFHSHMFFTIPIMPNIKDYKFDMFLTNENSEGFKTLVMVQNKMFSVSISILMQNIYKYLDF